MVDVSNAIALAVGLSDNLSKTGKVNSPTHHTIEPKTIAELEGIHTGSLMSPRHALLRCPETSSLNLCVRLSVLKTRSRGKMPIAS